MVYKGVINSYISKEGYRGNKAKRNINSKEFNKANFREVNNSY